MEPAWAADSTHDTNDSSRGSFIITQKENKGEYGAVNCSSDSCVANPEWKWNNSDYDWDIYAHVFDQNGPRNGDEIPYQYSTNISDWSKYYSNTGIIPRCTLIPNTVSGKLSFSTQSPSTDKACVANTHNAGNYYSFPAATAGSNNQNTSATTNMPNSICPKGWRLPPNDDVEKKSYNYLIRNASTYNISTTSSDTEILAAPLSFVRLGRYAYGYGSSNNRGNGGFYWSSTASGVAGSHSLSFNSGSLYPQDGNNRATGFSVRCVSR